MNQEEIRVGDYVESTMNQFMKYRVIQIGRKRAKLLATNGGAYFSCYCPVNLLRKIAKAERGMMQS